MMRSARRVTAILALAVLVLTGCYGNTESAESVTTTSARLMAWGVPEKEVGSTGKASNDYYFVYGPSNPPEKTTPVRHMDNLTIGQIYTIVEEVTGLSPDTRYYFKMCGKERAESIWRCGQVNAFVTKMFTMADPLFITPFGYYAHADIKMTDVGGRMFGTGTGCTLTEAIDPQTHFGTAWQRVNTTLCGTSPGQYPAMMQLNPSQQSCTFWATEMNKIGDQWVAVTTGARSWPERGAGYDRCAIWVATAPGPLGPWKWKDEALVKNIDDGLIDPSIFADPVTGRVWLTYTRQRGWTWPNGKAANTTGINELVAQELDPTDVTRLGKDPEPKVLLSTDVQPQDRERAYGRRIVEGQGVFAYAGRYYLYYAAGNYGWDTGGETYTFNIAESSATFPARFTKRANPDLRGTSSWRNPGHGSVFTDRGGNTWLAVSAWKNINGVWDRYPVLQKMTFDHVSKTFKIYSGEIHTGDIGVPFP